MIYLIHENNNVEEILDNGFNLVDWTSKSSITETIFDLANKYPNELIIWCHKSIKDFINKESLKSIFHHDRIMASFNLSNSEYIHRGIGYVDQTIYIKINKKVTYPTWFMSSDIGGIQSKLLTTIFKKTSKINDFNFFLNSISKQAMSQGLFCYSEPKLVLNNVTLNHEIKPSVFNLFKFVKLHYKLGWLFFLFLCFVLYERKFPFLQLINSIRYKRLIDEFDFSSISNLSSKIVVNEKEVDVIIPTIGRKNYLYNVLEDLSKQTILPKNVIIIEQNPELNSKSELDYLFNEQWPFKIKHKFIHQTGVCNARNLALQQVTSEWTLLGDDDNRFKPDLIERIFEQLRRLGKNVITTVYIQPNEKQTFLKTSQTQIFGGGNSFLNSKLLDKLKFDLAYEFGYGEDNDFGMQIRNLGEDVIFISDILITHLKAPIGGYRIKHKNEWDDDKYPPKPSPTIMLFNKRYFTHEQILGYKILLFIKFYRDQPIKNPFRYISVMNKRWNNSLYWSNILTNKKNA